MRAIPVTLQIEGVRCAQCGGKIDVNEEVLWRRGGDGGLFHIKCPSPVMMEREACLQVIERRLKVLEKSTLAGVSLARQNLQVVFEEIAGAAHLGNVIWPPPDERGEEHETWRQLADTACEILGRHDTHSRLLPEEKDDANKAFEMLGRLIDKTDRVEKS